MTENQALAQFATGSEEQARQAFDFLVPAARSYLHSLLRRTTGLTEDQREDVVQDTLHHVWKAHASYRNEGAAAWHGFLKTTMRHVCLDEWRRSRRQPEVSQDGAMLAETAVDECAEALDTLMDVLETQTVHYQADVLWLGLDTTLPPEAHTRRLLAAQYFYLDGLPWKTVLRLLGPARPGEPPLTRAVLDTWLADPGVLRHLAYRTLYYNNDRLAAYLLGFTETGELDAASRDAAHADPSAPGPGGTWAETAAILWRYRSALLFDQILQRDDNTLSSKDLALLIDRTLDRFPFSQEMDSLLAALGTRGRQALTDKGLWQRLAFQYRYVDSLPHQDIQDRIQPAYQHVADPDHPAITLGMLNVWLSNGRLLERLARACRRQKGREDHE